MDFIWVWVNTYRYIFSGRNIHLPAILGFTRYQGFDPSPFDFSIGEMIHQSCMIILMFSLDEWIVSPEQACVWLIGSVTATSVRYYRGEGITTIPKGPKPQPRKDLTMSCHFIHLDININMIIYIYIHMSILCLCIYIYGVQKCSSHPTSIQKQNSELYHHNLDGGPPTPSIR